jgi:ribosome-associated protein
MKKNDVKAQVAGAITACEAKKAADIALLELDKAHSGFTDYFIICSGSNPRQIQTISDEVEQRLSKAGLHPAHVEGYNQADWVLLDYVDFVVHVFSENARKFYDLERLWKSAKRLNLEELRLPVKKVARKRASASRQPSKPRSRTRTRKT